MKLIVKIYLKGLRENSRNYAACLYNYIDKSNLKRFENQNFTNYELSYYLSAKH